LFKSADDEVDALDAINNQMELLSNVINDCKGYWWVVSGLEKDDPHCTPEVHIQSQLLFCLMPISQHWDMCCEKAVQHMLLCGVRCSRTVRNWYLDFGKKKGNLA
jgi:hypothetical protein